MTIYQWTVIETDGFSFMYFESTDKDEAYKKAYNYYLSTAWDWVDDDVTPCMSWEEFRACTHTYVQYWSWSEDYDFHTIHVDEVAL